MSKVVADYSNLDIFHAPRLEYTMPSGFSNGGRILTVYEDVVDFVPDGGEYRELTFCLSEVRFIGAQETPANAADWK